MKKVYINGYFTKEHINGVPRYAMEIVKRLDKFFMPDEAELVIPKGAINIPELKNIRICTWEDRGCKKEINGVLWGDISYCSYVKRAGGLNINFSNRAEWIKNSITSLHDIIPLKNIKYSFLESNYKIELKRLLNNIWFRHKIFVKKHTAAVLVTVSEFSKKELQIKCKLYDCSIEVIGNGWEHINDIVEQNDCLDSRITENQYYFFIGNIIPRKNIKWILEEAAIMPDEYFVIAGKIPTEIKKQIDAKQNNIIFLGHISDEYMKYLMMNCKALLFPSYIEGFGIPPLEILSLGGKAVVANIPVMHEIYEECVYYINPNKGDVNLNQLISHPVEDAGKILEKHSWDKSAKEWFSLIDKARRQ